MKILFIGDIVGNPGREAIAKLLPKIKQEFNIELTVANAENAAGGAGLTPQTADELFRLGCDVLTTGDHIWDRKEINEALESNSLLVRPANFPEGAPGRGWCIFKAPTGASVAVVNLEGRVFMRYQIDCPFKAVKKILEELKGQASIILVDMHAEATSEKMAMAHFLDGAVSAVVGTHTHIQTADEKILAGGSAYITDLGMTGPYDSVIGQRKEKIIERFISGLPTRFEVACDDVQLCGAVLDIDVKTGKANSIQRIQRSMKT
ncbi:MAG: TIGR00282 family metallophosphoesterase [Candidatus Omnitrophota bacterium]|nr:TIGR00282 family metallophosphoesterase [Candidatus Omnitrophota bacterium]